jgi:anti-sigma factor RsiW
MRCADIERCVDSFIDREFAEPERLEFEAHLSECGGCRRLVQQQASFKATLRACIGRTPAPQGLSGLIGAALDREDERRREEHGLLHLLGADGRRRLVPLVLVALPLLLWLSPGILAPSWRESPVIAASIQRHQRDLPLEVTGAPEVVRSWFDGKVPFAVRTPRLEPVAVLRGGRLVSLGNQDAVHLIYQVGQVGQVGAAHRVSVFVFDANSVPLVAPRREVIGRHEVFLEGQRGYNVALFQDNGLGYVITGAIDEPEMIRLISTAVHSR